MCGAYDYCANYDDRTQKVNGILVYSGGAVENMPKTHVDPASVRDELEKREELCKIFGHRIVQKGHELF